MSFKILTNKNQKISLVSIDAPLYSHCIGMSPIASSGQFTRHELRERVT